MKPRNLSVVNLQIPLSRESYAELLKSAKQLKKPVVFLVQETIMSSFRKRQKLAEIEAELEAYIKAVIELEAQGIPEFPLEDEFFTPINSNEGY